MKTLKLFLICMLLISASCKNDDTLANPIDQLPPATQTGEQTFGCLINGEAFIPDTFGSGRPSAFYQFVDGAYTLGISASRGGGSQLESFNIGGLDISPIQETNYPLLEFESGNFFGEYFLGGGIVFMGSTSIDFPGIITITHFDPENFIISGNFEFTVLDNDGNEIKITNGRFDMLYTN
jgi:hypothetical protein